MVINCQFITADIQCCANLLKILPVSLLGKGEIGVLKRGNTIYKTKTEFVQC